MRWWDTPHKKKACSSTVHGPESPALRIWTIRQLDVVFSSSASSKLSPSLCSGSSPFFLSLCTSCSTPLPENNFLGCGELSYFPSWKFPRTPDASNNWIQWIPAPPCGFFFLIYWLKEREERERKNTLISLSHLFIHSLFDSRMCPDRGSNLQPWWYQGSAPTSWATQPGLCGYFSIGGCKS